MQVIFMFSFQLAAYGPEQQNAKISPELVRILMPYAKGKDSAEKTQNIWKMVSEVRPIALKWNEEIQKQGRELEEFKQRTGKELVNNPDLIFRASQTNIDYSTAISAILQKYGTVPESADKNAQKIKRNYAIEGAMVGFLVLTAIGAEITVPFALLMGGTVGTSFGALTGVTLSAREVAKTEKKFVEETARLMQESLASQGVPPKRPRFGVIESTPKKVN